MDDVKMLSVGIDIGTSTSQVIFSYLYVENTAGFFSVPSVEIKKKEILYQSRVYETPLKNVNVLDIEAIEEIVGREYRTAKIQPQQVQTGAVIITGESARKENAVLVLERLSRFAGDFVVSTAGPDMEAVIAGQGSGAQRYSRLYNQAVANVDIGGGTTNIAVFENGEIRAKGCFDIGGRQIRVSPEGEVLYIGAGAEKVAQMEGLNIKVGAKADKTQLLLLCEKMAGILEDLLEFGGEEDAARELQTPGASDFRLPDKCEIKYVCFSGGVAECIYRHQEEDFAFGDIGILLGRVLGKSKIFRNFQVLEPAETIRATVIGAGAYTTTISGSTIAYTEGIFPLKNIPVLKLEEQEEEDFWGGRGSIKEKIAWFLQQSDSENLVLALRGKIDPEYEKLKDMAERTADVLNENLKGSRPAIIIIEKDLAKVFGQIVRRRVKQARPVLVIDQIHVENNNYVDFGRPIMDGLVVPVIVKTLILG